MDFFYLYSNHACVFQVASEAGCSSEETAEDSVLLQLQQLSLPQYCLLCLSHSVPLLRPSSGPQRQYPALLAAEIVKLFAVCVKPNVWSFSDPVAQEVKEHVQQVLLLVGDVLESHRCLFNGRIRTLNGSPFSCFSLDVCTLVFMVLYSLHHINSYVRQIQLLLLLN
jgi:hypothetical protein